jgi:cytidyltransferase-like protein
VSEHWPNVIWEGRYQPIHRGHVAYIERLLEHADHVWIVVVANETSAELGLSEADLPVPEFTAAVDPHHRPEKNPLPFWLRYRLVAETLRAELPDAPITVWGGRRLDLDWPLYAKTLPPGRAFLTPLRDSFEDVKAAAWAKLGEDVLRIDVSDLPKISATMVRDRLRGSGPVEELLFPSTVALLESSGYLETFAASAG